MKNKSSFAILIITFVSFFVLFYACGDSKQEMQPDVSRDTSAIQPEAGSSDIQDKDNTAVGEQDIPETEKDINLQRLDSSYIKTGVIDVVSIDTNNDGRLFECPVDENVISDSRGTCPVCSREMKEYDISQVKKTLLMNNYKVK